MLHKGRVWAARNRYVLLLLAASLTIGAGLAYYSQCVRGPVWGEDESYQTASNRYLVREYLPSTARSINYYARVDRLTLVASFAVTEEEFLTWCNAHNWEPAEIHEPGTRITNVLLRENGTWALDGEAFIRSGYWYTSGYDHEMRVGNVLLIAAFDRGSNVAYFTRRQGQFQIPSSGAGSGGA